MDGESLGTPDVCEWKQMHKDDARDRVAYGSHMTPHVVSWIVLTSSFVQTLFRY